MMTSVGFKIWAKTVALLAVFVGVAGLFQKDWEMLLVSFLVLIAGGIVTLPLLMIIVPLVQLSARIPYGIGGRMAWLIFSLALLILAFFVMLNLLLGGKVDIAFCSGSTGVTSAAMIVAVLTTRRSLLKLYRYHDEAALMLNEPKL